MTFFLSLSKQQSTTRKRARGTAILFFLLATTATASSSNNNIRRRRLLTTELPSSRTAPSSASSSSSSQSVSLSTSSSSLSSKRSLSAKNQQSPTLTIIGSAATSSSSTSSTRSSIVPPPSDTKILNGHRAVSGDYPWFTTILEHSPILCGATLIAKDLLLTAAHCELAFQKGAVVVGSSTSTTTQQKQDKSNVTKTNSTTSTAEEEGEALPAAAIIQPQKVKIVDRMIHPEFKNYKLNDLLVLKIYPPISTIEPIVLDFLSNENKNIDSTSSNEKNINNETAAPSATASATSSSSSSTSSSSAPPPAVVVVSNVSYTIMGFGKTSDDDESLSKQFMTADGLQEISIHECQTIFGMYVNPLKHICVQKHTLSTTSSSEARVVGCGGDSGGPLITAVSAPQTTTTTTPTINNNNTINHDGDADSYSYYKQVGVLSFGTKTCSQGPSVFSRLSGYADFLTDSICSLSTYRPSYLQASGLCNNHTKYLADPCHTKQTAYQFCLAHYMPDYDTAANCVSCMNDAMPAVPFDDNDDRSSIQQCQRYESVVCDAPWATTRTTDDDVDTKGNATHEEGVSCRQCHPCARQLAEYIQCSSGCPQDCRRPTPMKFNENPKRQHHQKQRQKKQKQQQQQQKEATKKEKRDERKQARKENKKKAKKAKQEQVEETTTTTTATQQTQTDSFALSKLNNKNKNNDDGNGKENVSGEKKKKNADDSQTTYFAAAAAKASNSGGENKRQSRSGGNKLQQQQEQTTRGKRRQRHRKRAAAKEKEKEKQQGATSIPNP